MSVVVCTLNSAASVRESIESILACGPGEVVVVDGGSTDGTLDLARGFPNVKVAVCLHGLASQRNFGVQLATGPYVAFVDSDITLSPSAIRTMLADLLASKAAAVHARILTAGAGSYWEWAEDNHLTRTLNDPARSEGLGLAASVFRRSTLLKYPFDPFFVGASEDGDLLARLRRDGLRVGVSEAVAYHRHRRTLRDFVAQRIWHGQGTARLAVHSFSIETLLAPLAVVTYMALSDLTQRRSRMVPYWIIHTMALYAGIVLEGCRMLARRTTVSGGRTT